MSSFRGTEISVTEITLRGTQLGPRLGFRVHFSDGDGIVHAVTSHELDPLDNPDFAPHVRALLDALVEWSRKTHFVGISEPIASQEKDIEHGLAEYFGKAADPTKDPGAQG